MSGFTRLQVSLSDGRSFEGVQLPHSNEHTLVLKLDDGYNIGVNTSNIVDSKQLGVQTSPHVSNPTTIASDSALPKVLLLHTGGTIASRVDYATGGVSNLYQPEEILSMYPQLQQLAQVDAEFVANMSSDDFRFSHANILIDRIAKVVAEGQYSGIIITTGTDYLAFIAAALHYGLLGVPIPVVCTGSQRSSDRGSSDAALNLAGAVSYAAFGKPGVCVAMHEGSSDDVIAIHHAPFVRKMHTSARGAFRSINSSPLALVQPYTPDPISQKKIVSPQSIFFPQKYNESLKVGICLLHPHFHPEQLSCYSNFDALILLGSGLGHAPINSLDESTQLHEEIYNELSLLSQKIPVIMGSHCINGRVNLQVYGAGRRGASLGIIGTNLALPPETILCKVAWILSSKKNVASLLFANAQDSLDMTEEDSWPIH